MHRNVLDGSSGSQRHLRVNPWSNTFSEDDKVGVGEPEEGEKDDEDECTEKHDLGKSGQYEEMGIYFPEPSSDEKDLGHAGSATRRKGSGMPEKAKQEQTSNLVKRFSSQKGPSPENYLTESTTTVSSIVDKFIKKLLSNNKKLSEETLNYALQDCYGRFILNLPHSYLKNNMQICFAIQEAYWWYDDFWVGRNIKILPKLSMRNFGFLLCEQCPLLRLYLNSNCYSSLLCQWRIYCRTIPLKGAILINNDLSKVLMVQGWGGGSWMFPRGKVDEKEDDVACAVREIKEEIGVDISNIINENVYIEVNIDEQPLKLYVVPGILEMTPFEPRKRKEIGSIKWISLEDLPGYKKKFSKKSPLLNKKDRKRFWNVHPFMKALAGWVKLFQQGVKPKLITEKNYQNEGEQNEEEKGEPSNVQSDVWECCKNSWEEFSFKSPPQNHNKMLESVYNDLEKTTKKGTALLSEIKESENTECSGLPKLRCSSLLERQPAAAKPSPLPPFVDDSKWYCVSRKTSVQHLRNLQHPVCQDSGKRDLKVSTPGSRDIATSNKKLEKPVSSQPVPLQPHKDLQKEPKYLEEVFDPNYTDFSNDSGHQLEQEPSDSGKNCCQPGKHDVQKDFPARAKNTDNLIEISNMEECKSKAAAPSGPASLPKLQSSTKSILGEFLKLGLKIGSHEYSQSNSTENENGYRSGGSERKPKTSSKFDSKTLSFNLLSMIKPPSSFSEAETSYHRQGDSEPLLPDCVPVFPQTIINAMPSVENWDRLAFLSREKLVSAATTGVLYNSANDLKKDSSRGRHYLGYAKTVSPVTHDNLISIGSQQSGVKHAGKQSNNFLSNNMSDRVYNSRQIPSAFGETEESMSSAKLESDPKTLFARYQKRILRQRVLKVFVKTKQGQFVYSEQDAHDISSCLLDYLLEKSDDNVSTSLTDLKRLFNLSVVIMHSINIFRKSLGMPGIMLNQFLKILGL